MLLSKCLLNSSVQLSGEEVKMGLTPKKTAPLNLPHSLYSVFLSEADRSLCNVLFFEQTTKFPFTSASVFTGGNVCLALKALV